MSGDSLGTVQSKTLDLGAARDLVDLEVRQMGRARWRAGAQVLELLRALQVKTIGTGSLNTGGGLFSKTARSA